MGCVNFDRKISKQRNIARGKNGAETVDCILIAVYKYGRGGKGEGRVGRRKDGHVLAMMAKEGCRRG